MAVTAGLAILAAESGRCRGGAARSGEARRAAGRWSCWGGGGASLGWAGLAECVRAVRVCEMNVGKRREGKGEQGGGRGVAVVSLLTNAAQKTPSRPSWTRAEPSARDCSPACKDAVAARAGCGKVAHGSCARARQTPADHPAARSFAQTHPIHEEYRLFSKIKL